MSYVAGASFAKDAPVMVFGSLLPKRPRTVREERVREMAAALNALDYDRVATIVTEDVVVFNVMGHRTEGREAFIEWDSVFRRGAGCPQIRIEDLIHNGEEVLVSGNLESKVPDVGGPTMWRVGFTGPLISQIEITRS